MIKEFVKKNLLTLIIALVVIAVIIYTIIAGFFQELLILIGGVVGALFVGITGKLKKRVEEREGEITTLTDTEKPIKEAINDNKGAMNGNKNSLNNASNDELSDLLNKKPRKGKTSSNP